MLKAALIAISLTTPIAHPGINDNFGGQEELNKKDWARYLDICFEMDNINSVDACTKLIRQSPLSQKHINLIYGYRGYGNLLEGELEAAIDDFSIALVGNRKKAEFYNGRAMAYERLGKFNNALKDYSKAISTNTKYSQAYSSRGQLYRQMQKYDQAVLDLQKSIALRPENISGYYQLGFTYHLMEQYKRAIEIYTVGLRFDAANASLYAKRGLSHRKNGDVKSAIKDYTKAIKINPAEPVYYNNRAWAFMVEGKLKNGLNDANKALELDSRSKRAAAFYDTRAHIYEALGEKSKALVDFKNAATVSPSKKYLEQLKKRGVKP